MLQVNNMENLIFSWKFQIPCETTIIVRISSTFSKNEIMTRILPGTHLSDEDEYFACRDT